MDSIVFQSHKIRVMEKEDIPQIIDYIAKEWNLNHIFVRNPAFFEYEHCVGECVNGILTENLKNKKIDGILLMYPVGSKMADTDFFGGIWSVSKECRIPFMGIKLVENVLKLTGARSHSGVGINPETTARIFKRIGGQRVGKLKHYYRLGDRDEYKVASIKNKEIPEVKDGRAKLIKFKDIADLNRSFSFGDYKEFPYFKDGNYIKRRYFDHPIYKYIVAGIELEGKIEGILILRKVECNGAKIMRIVDFLGNDQVLNECGFLFQNLLEEEDLEYLDFYEYGLEDRALINAGFSLRENDINIIPNYFEPFVKKNIDIWFHTPYENCRIFKGDGDQDRPS